MIISNLLFILALIFLSFVISTYCDIKESYTPLVSVSLLMGLGILAGMLNILFIGTCVLYAVTIIGGVLVVIKNKDKFAKFVSSLPIVCLISSCLVIGVLFTVKEPFFTSWDEFSHWGPFLKSVKTTGKLHVYTDLYSVHPTYVQGMSVLYYISSFFEKAYSEKSVCFAYSTLLHICAITIVPNISVKKNYIISLANMLLIPLFWYFFPYASYAAPYSCSYLDTILGALFAATMMFILYNANRKLWQKKKLWCLSVLLFTLLQIKDISIAFYMICLATCTINLIYHMKNGANMESKTRKFLVLRHIIYTVIIPLSGKVLWSTILKATGRNVDQFSEAGLGKAFELFLSYVKGESDYYGQVSNAFWNGIETVNISWSRTAIPAFVFALLLISGVIIYKYKSEKNKLVSLHAGLFFGYFLVYLAVLFVIYLCGMSLGEALSNASMDRYIATFMSGWAMILFGLILGLLYKQNAKAAVGLVFAVSIYIYATIPMNGVTYWNVTKDQAGLTWYEEKAEACSAVMQEDSNVWLVKTGNEDWLSKFIFAYNLMPQDVCFDVSMDDTAYTAADIINMAETYEIDYFVVIDSNESFKEKYKKYISVEQDTGDERCMVLELTENGKMKQVY